MLDRICHIAKSNIVQTALQGAKVIKRHANGGFPPHHHAKTACRAKMIADHADQKGNAVIIGSG